MLSTENGKSLTRNFALLDTVAEAVPSIENAKNLIRNWIQCLTEWLTDCLIEWRTECLTQCSIEKLTESLAEWRAVLLFRLHLIKPPKLLTDAREDPKRYAETKLSEDAQDRFVY